MNLYSFRKMEKRYHLRGWDMSHFAECCATVALLTTDKRAVKAVASLTSCSMCAWETVTRTDWKTRAIAKRALPKLGKKGFVACLDQARHELGFV